MNEPYEITVIEQSPFQDFLPEEIFFLIGQHLDVISLCCLLRSCQATSNVFDYQYLWTTKLDAHFPGIDKNTPLTHRQLFETTYKEKYQDISQNDKKILALIYINDFQEIQRRASELDFINRLLTDSDLDGLPIWKHIRTRSSPAFKQYIFEQLKQKNLLFSDITLWAIRLDQRGYFSSYKKDVSKFIDLVIEDRSLLYYCAVHNFLVATEELLALGLDPEHTHNPYSTPLYVAAQEGHLEMVVLLLKHGAKIDTPFRAGYTPLYVASQRGYLDIIQCLIKQGAHVNVRCIEGSSPLYVAMQEGYTLVVDFLLKNGANIHLLIRRGFTPLYVGARNNHIEAVKMLLTYCGQFEKKLIIDALDEDGATPLYVAAQNGHHQMCKLLLAHDARIDARFLGGFTPLYVAAQNGHLEVLEVLFENTKEPDYNHKAPNNATALWIASHNNHPSIVVKLCQKGANPNSTCNEDSPLHVAAFKNNIEMISIILQYGATINFHTDNISTALSQACYKGHIETVKLLLDKGADFTLCAKDKMSPLHHACKKGHLAIINLLLSYGASLLAKDTEGKKPIDYISEISLQKKLGHLEKIEHYFSQITPTALNDMLDFSTVLSQVKRNFPPVSLTGSLDFFNTHSKSPFDPLRKLMEHAPNYLGPLCFCLIILSLDSTPFALKNQILQSLEEKTNLSAKNKLHAMLLTFLNGDSNLFYYLQRKVLSPILEGLKNGEPDGSTLFEEAFLFLSFFERQLKCFDEVFEEINHLKYKVS